MITIEHSHGMSSINNLKCPKGLKGGPMEHTIKTYRLLHQFLEQSLIGKEFEDTEQLQKALDKWPKFLEDKKFICDPNFSRLHISNGHISCTEDLGNIKETKGDKNVNS